VERAVCSSYHPQSSLPAAGQALQELFGIDTIFEGFAALLKITGTSIVVS
jgi:hypothetical protein